MDDSSGEGPSEGAGISKGNPTGPTVKDDGFVCTKCDFNSKKSWIYATNMRIQKNERIGIISFEMGWIKLELWG